MVVTYVGYERKEVAVSGSPLNITLDPSSTTLSEVAVVSVGYTTSRKKDVTGAVSVVNVEQMNKQPTGQVANQLQGQASGVTIIGSGQPGEEPQDTLWEKLYRGSYPKTNELVHTKLEVKFDYDKAWMYGFVSPNVHGDLAIVASVGGRGLYPSMAIGINGNSSGSPSPWDTKIVINGTSGPSGNKWGDYFRLRPFSGSGLDWAASG